MIISTSNKKIRVMQVKIESTDLTGSADVLDVVVDPNKQNRVCVVDVNLRGASGNDKTSAMSFIYNQTGAKAGKLSISENANGTFLADDMLTIMTALV